MRPVGGTRRPVRGPPSGSGVVTTCQWMIGEKDARTVAAMTAVTVVPVTRPLRDAVLALAPTAEQERWSGAAAQTLPAAEADPRRHPFVILDEQGTPAGFFVLDETPSPADPTADLVLRAFFVDQAHQGRGTASRALAALAGLVSGELPAARTVLLTVNVRNQVARQLYLRHGFTDTGELYLGGSAGPQHVLRLVLR
jgi:GNAT superfamily N-acetyltransferase